MKLFTWMRLKWIWFRHYYQFAWAHKPLCTSYHGETLKLPGDIFLCRSCTILWSGFALSLLTQWLVGFHENASGAWTISVIAITALTAGLSHPRLYKSWKRSVRDILRFSAGASGAAIIILGFSTHWLIPVIMGFTLFVFWKFYFKLRKDRRLLVCQKCHEYNPDSPNVCSGYKFQFHRIKRYQDSASQLIESHNPVPKCLTSPRRRNK